MVWVLRDFSLNFKHLTSKSYLEQCLEAQKPPQGSGYSEEADEEVFKKNSIRSAIKNFFKDLDCFTLVRPVHNEQQLAHVESMKYEDLREEFRAGMDNLMKKLKQEPFKLKTINDKVLNGSMLLGLALEYVDAINS